MMINSISEKALLLSIILILSSGLLQAQWQVTSDPGQLNFITLTTHDSKVYSITAADTNMLRVSENNGDLWQILNTENQNIQDIISVDNMLYSCAPDGYVAQSADGGQSWEGINSGLQQINLNALEYADSNLYVGGTGIYKSSDSGQNWNNISSNLTGEITCIKKSGNFLLAGTQNDGAWKTSNEGAVWTPMINNLPLHINTIDSKGNYWFAGTSEGIFYSNDAGASWNSTSVSDSISSFAIFQDYIFAGSYTNGVYLSLNSGISWQAVNDGLGVLNVNCLAVNYDYIFAGTTNKVWRRALIDLFPVNISIEIYPDTGGAVLGGGLYQVGSAITLLAVPAEGYEFVNWQENGTILSSESSYTFVANESRNILANFELINSIEQHQFSDLIIVYPNPGENGSANVFTQTPVNVTIYDELGRVFNSKQLIKGDNKINLNTGIYYFTFYSENNLFIGSRKIIIK
ncbi:MAG: T9SS type A sorting domain-containing protein [Bacteroidia bacterium]